MTEICIVELEGVKHSYVKFFCESNFAPILEFATFYYFRRIYIGKSYLFSKFLIISSVECMLF